MNRLDWQQLAERWILDSSRLLEDRRWSAAYYLAGYAVECGLKACVLKHVAAAPEVIFSDKKFSEKCWTHSISDLMKLADLEGARAADAHANADFGRNWLVAKDWSEKARYASMSHQKAKKLFEAITNDSNGVMQWIRGHW